MPENPGGSANRPIQEKPQSPAILRSSLRSRPRDQPLILQQEVLDKQLSVERVSGERPGLRQPTQVSGDIRSVAVTRRIRNHSFLVWVIPYPTCESGEQQIVAPSLQPSHEVP